MEYSCPAAALQQRYPHLRVRTPLPQLNKAQPFVLGFDHAHLIIPTELVHTGPPGAPSGVCTALGWAIGIWLRQQCYFTATPSSIAAGELMRNIVKLWQLDSFPHQNEKGVTRSKLDQYALHLLDSLTERVALDGQMRYATPVFCHPDFPSLNATKLSALWPPASLTPVCLSADTACSAACS